ncbi:MAG: hypothetical protein JRI47_07330 [Deltaproteobacteria bacterium]|nr:hypothetical protein [Deltaproteobacteria bacterium]
MNTAEQVLEQRASRRFRVQTGVLAQLNAKSTKVCHLADVSASGLCFTYVAKEKWLETFHLLNIFFPLKGFLLKNIPFETIYDFLTDAPYSSLPLRRRGGRFGRLTTQQLVHLKHFIKSCTIGEPEKPPYSIVARQPSSSLVVTQNTP